MYVELRRKTRQGATRKERFFHMEVHNNCGLFTLTKERVESCYKDLKVGLKQSEFGNHVYRKNVTR